MSVTRGCDTVMVVIYYINFFLTLHKTDKNKKKSESQTKAGIGNQKEFENLKIRKFKFKIQKLKCVKLILGTC